MTATFSRCHEGQSLTDSLSDLIVALQPDADLRTAARVEAQESIQVWFPDLGGVPLDSTSMDLSEGGLSLHSPMPLGPGAACCVRLADEVPDGGWIPLEVRHCRPDATGWILGCRFVNDVPGVLLPN